ncbi:uncharacterized protein [Struthio camelus]|uniref:uncharacterized protein isoform X2 n=1 Tax=Struthio camelus TaxID=8801 RepID=UPI003603FD90
MLGGTVLHMAHRGHVGRLRAPPAPWWRWGLRAWCWRLLALARTALSGLLVLWRLAWYLLICYKLCWELVFQFVQELGWPALLRPDGDGEAGEEDGASPSTSELEQAGPGELQRLRDTSAAVLKRLEALEADISFFGTELGAEKLLWSSRFLELLREQQALAARGQECCWLQCSGNHAPARLLLH